MYDDLINNKGVSFVGKSKKVKKGIFIVVIVVCVISSGFVAAAFWLNQTIASQYFRGYDDGIEQADRNGDYVYLNLTEQFSEDYNLTLDKAYLGIKRIIISYTLASKSGKIPLDYKTKDVASKCSISIDGWEYDVVDDVTLFSSVAGNNVLKGALLLDEINYGTDFALSENSIFNIYFNDLLNTNKDINFKFDTDELGFSKNQIDFEFKHKNKKYNIESIELDSITTTLNFSKAVNITGMKIVQGEKEYQPIVISNKGQHYISFPAVKKGVPFSIYIGDEKLHASSGERIYTHTFY